MLGHLASAKRMKIRHVLLASGLLAGALLGRMSVAEFALHLLTRIWVAFGDARRSLWFFLLDAFAEDQFSIFVVGSLFITIVLYWVIGGVYTCLDVFLKPEGMRKYKIQPGKNEPVPPERLKQVIGQILYNQTIVGIPVIYLGAFLVQWRKPPPLRQLPDFHWVLLQFVFSALVEEVGYYYIHRLFHSKYFYKKVHKRHHEWTAPVAITAMYCHPVEQALANLAPIFLGPFIVNAHLSTYLTWFALAVVFTLSEHSGYHLPFMTSSEYHDFHHLSFNNNFGFLGIMDSLYSTNDQFKRSVVSSRHFILKSLKSAREHVPDPVESEPLCS